MSDIELEEAVKNIKSVANRNTCVQKVYDPLFREALRKINNSKLVTHFSTRLAQLEETLKTTKSRTIKSLLANCISETKKAKRQYGHGQLRPLILHLNSDISICTMLTECGARVINRANDEELKVALREMRQRHELINAYLSLGPVSSEDAIMVHLDLTEWLATRILSPVHWKQHLLTAMDFAKATAGLIPGFGYMEYVVAIHRMAPSERIRINLVAGDCSVSYWEEYLQRIEEWQEASVAFQFRIQDSLMHMSKTVYSE